MHEATFNLSQLQARADLYKKIRSFFDTRGVMEVETPLMTPYTVTDPHVHSIDLKLSDQTWFLQTSPEYMMKQLLALGCKDIYQICKAFRSDDFAQFHQPEFSMLEWYRIDYDYQTLMQEVVAMIRTVFDPLRVAYYAYEDLFNEVLGVNPLTATCEELREIACLHLEDHAFMDFAEFTLTDWQQYLFSQLVEPVLSDVPCAMVYNFPISHSSLAKPSDNDPRVSERFEMYLNGVECANGFSELVSDEGCIARFKADMRRRERLGMPGVSVDQNFIEAMRVGLPKCAGVSIGLDRLLMVLTKTKHIAEVIPRKFNFDCVEQEVLMLSAEK
ncbi:MAG: EF-P lysine aminoacylase EpmA [Gammaproteobacteria bacterium]|nr:EF-P lysine aminoacylase EpmA [Gammaproteobacteria bacterium]